MATRKIKCTSCGTSMGEIRNAKLKIGLVFLCVGCEKTRKLAVLYMNNNKNRATDIPDFLNGLFK